MENKILEEMANEYQESWLRGYCNGTNAIKIKHAFKDGYKAGFDAAKKEETDVVKVMPQWISVKERLPKIDEWVLIDGPEVCKRIEPPSSNWKESYAWETNHNSFYSPNDVTHWMPLPTPPEGHE